jgi:hypothetical protein
MVRKINCKFLIKLILGAAALSSGLARLSIALRVRGSNPGVNNGEKGINHLSPFFELYRISLVHYPVCGLEFWLPWLISHRQWNDHPSSSTAEEWNIRKEENLNPVWIIVHNQKSINSLYLYYCRLTVTWNNKDPWVKIKKN